MITNETFYQEVTKIAEDYFGPAAPRVMGRLISNHLQKSPNELVPHDMPALTKWTGLAISMVTEDTLLIEDFIRRLEAIGAPGKLPSS
jgi:hypothetical protein